MTIAALHRHFLEFPIASTDTRNIAANSIFFALKGANFNGNSYASEALKQGAAFAVIDNEEFAESVRYILVDDVLRTLQQLATYHRNYCSAKIIGLTGSNGKTTTKELINAVLSTTYKTMATLGNLNNHIGVPLTLLSLRTDTELAIVEMGANHQNEIAFLSNLARPDYGYITNFGKAHLEGFGNEAGVVKGKSELYDYLKANDKEIFLNADDAIQMELLDTYIKKYGFSALQDTYFKVLLLDARPFVTLKVEDMVIRTRLIGRYNFTNCCAAILMGKYFNVPLVKIKQALENYIPQNNRSQLIERDGRSIILDAYNANPTSMLAALQNFETSSGVHTMAFLGDMFELGDASDLEHQALVNFVEALKIDEVFLIGEHFYKTKSTLRKFRTYDSVAKFLGEHPLPKKCNILIKGSRGMALERLVSLI